MLDAPNEGDWGLILRDEFIDVTVQAGFTSVRLPVRWSNHTAPTAPFTIAPGFLSRVESVLGKLLAKGVYVVLDMHHYRQLDGDPLDSGESAVDSTILDVHFLRIWQQIAERFRGKSNHLLFELYNEPHGRLTPRKWNDLAARALNVVRKNDPTRIVVIGPTNWSAADALSSLRLPNDANLIVTVHNYEPFDFTHQGADWVQPILPTGVRCCDASQQAAAIAPLATAKAWSDSVRYPIFLGEFGAYDKADMRSRVQFTRLMRDAAEARGIRWTYWELAAGFGVYDPVAHTWRTPLKDALLGN
jgi:endoglucanase